MADLNVRINEAVPDDGGRMLSGELFKRSIDERLMSEIFSEIDQKFFGPFATEMLDGRYNKRVDLIAYLFIIVEWYRLGNSEFSERSIKPFFVFCKKKLRSGGRLQGDLFHSSQ